MTSTEAAPPDAGAGPGGSGVYCSTAGTAFIDKASLVEHYKSEYHRYNLKRNVAGLPPVTREWYDARAAALAARGGGGGAAPGTPPGARRSWFDPLTRKRFASEATYRTFVASKKYRDAVKASGAPAPPPVVAVHAPREDAAAAAPAAPPARPGFKVAAPNGVAFDAGPGGDAKREEEEMEEEMEEGSGWETASDVADADDVATTPDDWVEWDPKRSLFDNKMFKSVEANLEHMWKRYGFYLPDAAYVADPEGLLSYLGSKIANGRVALYTRGDDDTARVHPSLHAVQRHMVDTAQCKLAWEGNEAEYEDFYDYSGADGGAASGGEGGDGARPASSALAPTDAAPAAGDAPAALASYELALPSGAVLGSRHLARYYRQAVRPRDPRRSEAVRAALVELYTALGVAAHGDPVAIAARAEAQKGRVHAGKTAMKTALRANVNRNLPRNVPY